MPALFFTENEQSPRTLLKNTSLVNLSSPATPPCCCFLVMKLWLTLCDPMDCSLPDSSSVHGISQARILEWVTISRSRGSSLSRGAICIPLHWLAGSLPLSPRKPPPLPQESMVKRTKHRANDRPTVHGPLTQ